MADSAKAKAAEVADSVKAKDKPGHRLCDFQSTSDDLGAKAAGAVASVKGSAQDIVDKGKALVDNQKSAIQEGVDAGKKAYQEKNEELTATIEGDGKPSA